MMHCNIRNRALGLERSLAARLPGPGRPLLQAVLPLTQEHGTRSLCCHAAPPDGSSKDSSQPAGPRSGSQLPPRPPKSVPAAPEPTAHARSSGRASSSGRRLEDFKRGLMPPPLPPPSNERVLAGVIAYSGMLGTIACAIAQATHIDVWGSWHWDVHDTALAMAIVAPVLAINAAIIVPDYSNWRLPDVEVLMARRERRPSADREGGDAASSPSASQGAAAAAAAAAPATATAATAAAGSSSDAKSAVQLPVSGSGLLPAAQWGKQQQQGPSLRQRWKDAFHLAQGMLLSGSSPASSLHPALGGAVLALDTLATELLYRSVLLQLLGGWMSDRLYEAGLDEAFPVPIATLGGAAAVSLLTATSALAVLRRAVRVARRRPLVLDLSKSSRAEGKARLVVMEGSQAEALAPKAAGAAAAGDGKIGKERLVLPGSGGVASAVVLSQVVQGARELVQNTALGVAFVVVGNMSAVFAAALVNTLLLASLQKWGQARTRTRSLAFAQQLQELNTKMQRRIKVHDANVPGGGAVERRDLTGAAASRAAEGSTDGQAATGSSNGASSSTGPSEGIPHLGGATAAPLAAEGDQAFDSHGSGHMAETISLLDMLLGEQLSAAPGGHPGK